MQCVSCGSDNPDGMKFCGECGTPFKSCCPQCGFENPPKFKFCGECGTPLAEQVSSSKFQVSGSQPLAPSTQSPASYTPKHLAERSLAEQAAMEARGMPDGERKTITALFADIKGSTALIEDLDPEEARQIVDTRFAEKAYGPNMKGRVPGTWKEAARILRERHGIEWKNPMQLNPGFHVD